jgi:hypothetical protein
MRPSRRARPRPETSTGRKTCVGPRPSVRGPKPCRAIGLPGRRRAGLNGPGKIAGTEILAYADDGSGRQSVAMLLQIPASFDEARGCILAVPVNGSARLFADVLRIGAWGLRRSGRRSRRSRSLVREGCAHNTKRARAGFRADPPSRAHRGRARAALAVPRRGHRPKTAILRLRRTLQHPALIGASVASFGDPCETRFRSGVRKRAAGERGHVGRQTELWGGTSS